MPLTIIVVRILTDDDHLDLVQRRVARPGVNVLRCSSSEVSSRVSNNTEAALTRWKDLPFASRVPHTSHTFLPQRVLELEEVRAPHLVL